jgi:hypothetical protein
MWHNGAGHNLHILSNIIKIIKSRKLKEVGYTYDTYIEDMKYLRGVSR